MNLLIEKVKTLKAILSKGFFGNLDDRLSFDEHLFQGSNALLQVLHCHLES